MANYYGNLLIKSKTLEHRGAFFELVMGQIPESQQHDIQAVIDPANAPARDAVIIFGLRLLTLC